LSVGFSRFPAFVGQEMVKGCRINHPSFLSLTPNFRGKKKILPLLFFYALFGRFNFLEFITGFK
jgi:hypothetical protein